MRNCEFTSYNWDFLGLTGSDMDFLKIPTIEWELNKLETTGEHQVDISYLKAILNGLYEDELYFTHIKK